MSYVTSRYNPVDELFRGFFVKPVDVPVTGPVRQIRVDVHEDENAYQVFADIPGIRKEDIHVEIEGNQVTIRTEIKEEANKVEAKEGVRVLRAERYRGQASRAFQLAQDIDESKAVAAFNNGVLELTLPKKAAATKRLVIN